MTYTTMESPVGVLTLAGDDAGLRQVRFGDDVDDGWVRDDGAHADAVAQLTAYFAGELREFDLDLAPKGTAFQLAVWRALQEVPYGTTTTYAAIARRIGRPMAVRAVGAANGANPLAIVVPCHRIIGSSGRLVGYAGGLPLKRALLALEAGPSLF